MSVGHLRTLAAAFMLHSLVACSPDSRFEIDPCITPERFFAHYGAYLKELRDPRIEPRPPPYEVVSATVRGRTHCPDESLTVLEQETATHAQKFEASLRCKGIGFSYESGFERSGGFSGGYFRGLPGSDFEVVSLMRGYHRVDEGRVDRILFMSIDPFEGAAIQTRVVFKYADFKTLVCAGQGAYLAGRVDAGRGL